MHESARHVIDLYQRHALAWDRLRQANTEAFAQERLWLERFMAGAGAGLLIKKPAHWGRFSCSGF